MSILSISGYGFGIMSLVKGFAGETARLGTVPVRRTAEVPVRRVRSVVLTHVREPEMFEEDAERWDGLA